MYNYAIITPPPPPNKKKSKTYSNFSGSYIRLEWRPPKGHVVQIAPAVEVRLQDLGFSFFFFCFFVFRVFRLCGLGSGPGPPNQLHLSSFRV